MQSEIRYIFLINFSLLGGYQKLKEIYKIYVGMKDLNS
jgi:hypothetical protein